MKGWHYESYRHSLAAKGVRTSLKPIEMMPTRYNPVRKDKVVVVDLDNTIADVVQPEVYDQEFNFINQIGPVTYRRLMVEEEVDPDIIDKVLRAHEIYKAGQMKTMYLPEGKFYIFPRIGMVDKLKDLAKKYRLVVYTAATPNYAKEVLDQMGISDVFEDIYARPFMEAVHAHDELISDDEGEKPLTPLAERLGVARRDLLILDDRMDFVGPETMYRWVRSPSFLPDETQMQVFFGNIDRRLAMDADDELKNRLPPAEKPSFWSKPPRVLTPEVKMERLDQLFPRAHGIAPVEKQEQLLSSPDGKKPSPFFTDVDDNLSGERGSFAFKMVNTPAFKGKDRTSKLLETGSSIGFNIRKALYYDLPLIGYDVGRKQK